MSYKSLIEKIEHQDRLNKEKVETKLDPMEVQLGIHNRTSISFNLYAKTTFAGESWMQMTMCPDHGEHLITLDREDLEYLHKKYSPKVAEEVREEKQKELEKLVGKADTLRSELKELEAKIEEVGDE